MKAEVEVYRGIEFVRLSVLAREDAKAIRESSFGKKIIKILHGSEILPDCMPWSSYLEWYNLAFPVASENSPAVFDEVSGHVKLASSKV